MQKAAKDEKDMLVWKDITVQQILDQKAGGQPAKLATVSPKDTVYNAIKMMSAAHIGALVVADETSTPVGMISERDYLNKVIVRGFSSKDISVKGTPRFTSRTHFSPH